MNITNLSIQSWHSYQFLAACQYNSNEMMLKRRLLRKILNGTGIHGGHKKNTLDIKYINQTYEYIISNTVFATSGGIPGYLARSIAMNRNTTLSIFKERVDYFFIYRSEVYDYCSKEEKRWTLSELSLKKIVEDYLWSEFPQPEEDMKIMDINYIYAMIGLKMARSANLSNLSFVDYVQLGSSAELPILSNATTSLPVELFSTPALLYFAHETGNDFFSHDLSSLSSTFWDEVYRKFFSYLNETKHNALQKFIKESLYLKLENDVAKIVSRIHSNYKSSDLTKDHEEQFKDIRDTCNKIEKGNVEQALKNADFLDKLNLPNTYVYKAHLLRSSKFWCFFCELQTNPNIYLLFAIVQNDQKDFYALKQTEKALILLSRDENKANFDREVGNLNNVVSEVVKIMLLKDTNQNATDFKEFLEHDRTESVLVK